MGPGDPDWGPGTLPDAEFVAWMHRADARLEALDREIAHKEAADNVPPEDNLRASVAYHAPRDLAALGVPKPYGAWALGVVQTRVWLLEIAQYPCADDFQRFRMAMWTAENVRDGRRKRRFGALHITEGDVEEARHILRYNNERWEEIRACAGWVLRDLNRHRIEPDDESN